MLLSSDPFYFVIVLFLLFTLLASLAIIKYRGRPRADAIGFLYGALLMSSLLVGLIWISLAQTLSVLSMPSVILVALICFLVALAVIQWKRG